MIAGFIAGAVGVIGALIAAYKSGGSNAQTSLANLKTAVAAEVAKVEAAASADAKALVAKIKALL